MKSKKHLLMVLSTLTICSGIAVFAYASFSNLPVQAAVASNYPNTALSVPAPQASFIELMADAKPIDIMYQFTFSLLTDYDAESADMYLFDPSTDTVQRLGDDLSIINNIVTHTRRTNPVDEAYLVLHVNYGPKFTYDRHSEAICVTKLRSHIRLDPIACNPLTTSEYLFGAAMENVSSDNFFVPSAIKRAISLQRLPRSVTLQRLYAIHQYVLAHVAESPQYQKVNLQDQYLTTLYPLFQNSINKLLKFRRLTIKDMDTALVQEDSSMVNMGYRIYMALELLIKRHSQTQSKIQDNPKAMKDFFNGTAPFTILGSDSDLVANLQITDAIHFDIWPWFSYVEVSFDEADPARFRFGGIPLVQQHDTVTLRGFGENGRYVMLRQHIKHTASSANLDVVEGAE